MAMELYPHPGNAVESASHEPFIKMKVVSLKSSESWELMRLSEHLNALLPAV